MSVHAPYYISLSGVDQEKRLKSIDYIEQSVNAAAWLGADIIVIHTGSAAKISRKQAMEYAKDTLYKTLEKIEKDIIRTKAKISEYQQKLRNLEAQKVEAENLQIVNLVKAVKLSTPQLTVLLSAYAKGDVLLPDEYEEELKAIEENEQQEDGTNEE